MNAPLLIAQASAPEPNTTGDDETGTIQIEIKAQGLESVAVDGQTVAGAAESTHAPSAPGAADMGTRFERALDTVQTALSELLSSLLHHLPQILIAVIIVIATAILARLAFRLSQATFGKARLRGGLRDLFAQLIYLAAWFIGLLLAAGVVFPGFGMGQLIATAGLASIAIGFAFQDIFENFFAGILILWRFPFEVGDFIEVEGLEGVEGEVEDIWIRCTLIRQTTGELTLVPNAMIYKNPVKVLTNRRSRRVTVMAGVAYGEDVDQSREVIRQAVEACETVHKDHPIEIYAQAFGASSIDFEVTWWTGPKPGEVRQSRDEIVAAVKRGLDEAGIEIPYPYRTLVFSKNEPDIINAVSGRTGGGARRENGEP